MLAVEVKEYYGALFELYRPGRLNIRYLIQYTVSNKIHYSSAHVSNITLSYIHVYYEDFAKFS